MSLLILVTCTSKTKLGDDPNSAASETNSVLKDVLLVEDGDNSQPSFDSTGEHLLFVSSKRPSHQQRQVYELDLKSHLEHRVTFQNGSTWNPHYQPGANAIVYASSTDEEKENPALLHLGLEARPSVLPEPLAEPLELYLHSLAGGLAIERLTSRPGFEGEAHFTNDGKSLTFTRVRKERSQIFELNLSSKAEHILRALGENPTDYILSPDGKTQAWIDWNQVWSVSRLRILESQNVSGKDMTEITPESDGLKSDPTFSPDSKWLLWTEKDPQSGRREIKSFELKTACVQTFEFKTVGDRFDPVVSPDGKWLVYAWQVNGRSRIAKVPFRQRTGSCPASP